MQVVVQDTGDRRRVRAGRVEAVGDRLDVADLIVGEMGKQGEPRFNRENSRERENQQPNEEPAGHVGKKLNSQATIHQPRVQPRTIRNGGGRVGWRSEERPAATARIQSIRLVFVCFPS